METGKDMKIHMETKVKIMDLRVILYVGEREHICLYLKLNKVLIKADIPTVLQTKSQKLPTARGPISRSERIT